MENQIYHTIKTSANVECLFTSEYDSIFVHDLTLSQSKNTQASWSPHNLRSYFIQEHLFGEKLEIDRMKKSFLSKSEHLKTSVWEK